MNAQEYIYRYRELKTHNIRCLLNDSINGSLFSTFSSKDQGEMNYGLSDDFLVKNNIVSSEADYFIQSIISNTKNNYYLACFTLNEPRPNSKEWIKYAKNGIGYCLKYRICDIKKEIDYNVRFNKKVFMFDKVHYSNKIYYFDSVAEELIRIVKTHSITTQEKLNKIDYLKYDERIGHNVCRAFFHKSDKFSYYNEMRIVELVKNDGTMQNSKFKDCVVRVKPVEIIIPRKIAPFDYSELLKYAREVHIPVTYM